jgi:hypothetical protein
MIEGTKEQIYRKSEGETKEGLSRGLLGYESYEAEGGKV